MHILCLSLPMAFVYALAFPSITFSQDVSSGSLPDNHPETPPSSSDELQLESYVFRDKDLLRRHATGENSELVDFFKGIDPSEGSYAASTDSGHEIIGSDALDALQGETDATLGGFEIVFQPNLDPAAAEDTLERNGLFVREVFANESFPGFVSVDTVKILSERPLDPSSFDYRMYYEEAMRELKADPNISIVAPNINELSSQNLVDLELSIGPMPFGDSDEYPMTFLSSNQNEWDWGLDNIGAPDIWQLPNAYLGRAIGVLDVGFGFHQDLPLWDPPLDLRRHDHGTHVAGIACAKHNGVGTNGVLPTCMVIARTPDASGLPSAFGVRPSSMTAVLNAFTEIVEGHDEIKAVNISLGYNWRQRGFTLLDENTKQSVGDIAALLLPVYSLAKERDIFIVSAAGNDSLGLEEKMNAAFASPMNLASLTFCRELGLCNGVVVEAHDRNDAAAEFSNIGGNLSCPGVDIASTVAFNEDNQESNTDYATDSGTSMASPYCAAGLVLLSIVRPQYSVKEIIDCAVSSGRSTGAFSAPALDLRSAVVACP